MIAAALWPESFVSRGLELDAGDQSAVDDLAAAEKVNASYLSRVLRLALLAPDILEAILDGRRPTSSHLDRLLAPFALIGADRKHLSLGSG